MRLNIKSVFLMVVCLLIIQLCISGIYADCYSESGYKDGEIRINVSIGYDGFYKLGSIVPIYIDIENNLKDINGELQIEIPDDYENIVIYSINVSLPQNTSKQFVMNVPMMRFTSKLKVNIVQGKKTIITKTRSIQSSHSGDTLVIGMLSDDYESIRYINTIPLGSNNNIRTVNVHLSEKQFPQELDALKIFNVLVINNYDTSRLSEKQYEALKKWVEDGGTLLIGTGSSYTKTLAVFKDDFITGKIGEVSLINTEALYQLIDNSSSDNPMKLGVLDINLNDSTVLLDESGLPLVQKLQKNKGVVAVTAFDLGMDPFVNWVGTKSFGEGLLKAILPSYYSNVYFEKGMMMRENYYAIDNSLRTIPELPQPKTTKLFIMFAAYIIAAAPLSYIILKKLDKRELMWITVPALAIVFSVLIYITGYGTRLTEPLANIISIVDIDANGNISSNNFAGILTPNKNSLKIESGEELTVKPMNFNNAYIYGPMNSENERKKIVSKVTLSPMQAIEFYDIGVWGMKNVILESKKTKKGNIETDLFYLNKHISGTITNLSGYDLEDCYIITSNQYVAIDDVKNGETINIDKYIRQYYGNRYDLINALFSDPYNRSKQTNMTEQEIIEFRENMQKRQVFEYYHWADSGIATDVKLLGWSKTPTIDRLIVNGADIKKIEKSLIAAAIKLNYRNGNTVEYPLGHIKPVVINNLYNGHYDEMGKVLYGRGSVEVHFEIDKDIIPEEVLVETSNTSSNIKKYVWNFYNSSWEDINTYKLIINEEKLKQFIDSKNTLRLRFELNDDSMPLPQISVKGSVK